MLRVYVGMRILQRGALFALLVSAAPLWTLAHGNTSVDEWSVRSASAANRHLLISLRNGRVAVIPPDDTGTSFQEIGIAPDHRTIGWVAMSKVTQEILPGRQEILTLPHALRIWRDGHVVHSFLVSGVEADWKFYMAGDTVAIHVWPQDVDEEQHCVLYDVRTGGELDTWGRSKKTPVPKWCDGLVER
jgi:hypothetical protein